VDFFRAAATGNANAPVGIHTASDALRIVKAEPDAVEGGQPGHALTVTVGVAGAAFFPNRVPPERRGRWVGRGEERRDG
jgi:hypothetical protein